MPQRIALDALIERGPAGPKNVILTDYRPCRNIVVEERFIPQPGGRSESRWLRAYVPVVPTHPGDGILAELEPVELRVVIHCPDVADETQLFQRCGGRELKGLVVGTIADLSRDERQLLQQRYPGTDPAKCVVITEGAEPEVVGDPGVMRYIAVVLMAAGAIFLGIAAVLLSDRRAVSIAPGSPPTHSTGGDAPPDGSVPGSALPREGEAPAEPELPARQEPRPPEPEPDPGELSQPH